MIQQIVQKEDVEKAIETAEAEIVVAPQEEQEDREWHLFGLRRLWELFFKDAI